MIHYILNVGLMILICLSFYRVMLQNTTFYRLNRVVLIACLLLAFVLPLIDVPQEWSFTAALKHSATTPAHDDFAQVYNPSPAENVISPMAIAQFKTKNLQPNNSVPLATLGLRWLVYLYWCGVVIFSANFLLQLFVLHYQAHKSPAAKHGRLRIVEINSNRPPCSFGNNIFINSARYDSDTFHKILLHEKVHVQQRHTFDIVMTELALIFQWFNPFAWLYKKALHNNLEFLADDCVLGYHKIEKQSYQESLLRVTAPYLALTITANYNQSFLKQRIIMMNAKKSGIGSMCKYLFLLPLLIFVMCAFNNTAANSSANKKAGRPAKDGYAGHIKDTLVDIADADTTKKKSKDTPAAQLDLVNPGAIYTDTIIDGKEYKIVRENGKVTELHTRQAEPGDSVQGQSHHVWYETDARQDSLNIIQEKKNLRQDTLNLIQDEKNLKQDTLNLLQDEKNLKQVALNKIQNIRNLRTSIGQNKINLQQDSLNLLQQEKDLRLLQEQNKNVLVQNLLTLEQDKRNLQYNALQLGQDENRYKTAAKN